MATTYGPYISKVTLPNGTTYDVKDQEARELIAALQGVVFHKVTDASDTPVGVTWESGGTTITGTLTAANAEKSWIYLVPTIHTETKDIYAEYITVNSGTSDTPVWNWEKLGDTEIDFDLQLLKDNISLNKVTDIVLGESTTFTDPQQTVSFTAHTQIDAVTDISGSSSNLVTSNLYPVTGSTTPASLATQGTAFNVAKAGDSRKQFITGIGSASSAVVSATVSQNSETLVISSGNIAKDYVRGVLEKNSSGDMVADEAEVVPYTFTPVNVPITGSQITYATGSLSANAGGGSVLVGLGTITTDKAIKTLGTGTTAEHSITVGSNDKVTALTSATDLDVDQDAQVIDKD